jgi:prepilin-type N-terminal cleavage/methylation domain-containing protein
MDQRVHPTGRGRRADDDGFTLIEILIAIVLVGILSAVAVLGIGSLLGKAKSSACAAERDSLTTAVTAYFALNNVDKIPADPDNNVTPMDTIRLAGLINENSKMYAIGSDGSLTPIKNNPNHCVAVTSDNPPATDQSGTNPSGTDETTTTAAPGQFIQWSDNLNAVASDGQATFTWNAATYSGFGPLDHYTVTNNVGGVCQVPPTQALTCTIAGLTNGTKYRFWVSLTFVSQTSSGGTFIFVTPDAENPIVAPGTTLNGPTNLQAVAVGDGTATLTWDASTSDGGYPITDYYIIDYNGNPFTTCHVAPTDPLTCTLTGLVDGTTYNFSVGVTNQPGDQTSSQPVLVTPAAAD